MAAANAVETALGAQALKNASVVWLTDGIDHDKQTRAFAERLEKIASGGTLAVIDQQAGSEPVGIVGGLGRDGKLEATVLRTGGPARAGSLSAFSARCAAPR